MGSVVTVLGAIRPEDLGFCHSHEHLSIAKGQSYKVNPALRIDDTETTLEELRDYKNAGGRAVVDAQPVGCGRDASVLAELSERSGVHIVAATGFHKMVFYPKDHWVFRLEATDLAMIFMGELELGMYLDCDDARPYRQCGHRAGLIKTALDSGEFTPQYRKLFTAAAEASNRTGAALMVHIEKDSDPVALADFLAGHGVDLCRVVFCHMDRMIPDLAVHKALCGRGISMEYDTIARGKYHSDEREAAIVAEMAASGYEDQILMALDVTRERLVRYGGTVGLPYIKERFIPLLLKNGIAERTVDKIFVKNPAAFFAS